MTIRHPTKIEGIAEAHELSLMRIQESNLARCYLALELKGEQLAACQRRCAELQAKGEEDLKLCYREMDADSKAIEHLHAQIAGLEATVTRLKKAHEGAHMEVLRLAILLRRADPKWRSKMHLNVPSPSPTAEQSEKGGKP